MKHRAQGTALLQLSIVIVCVVILTSFTVASVSFYKRYIVCAQAQKIKTLFLLLQQKALVMREEIRLVCDVTNRTLSTSTHKEELAQGVFFGYLQSVMGPPSKPNQLLHNPITFANNTAIFYPDGTISSGTIYLIDAQKSCMYAITCPSGQVGFIRIYRYDHGWNILT